MYEELPVSAIVAVADNGVIGVDGDLPWHLPDDLRWFKRVTSGHAVIMGRKTWQTLPGPLPRRLNVVLTRDPKGLDLGDAPQPLTPMGKGGQVCAKTSIHAALAQAAAWERAALAEGRIQQPDIMVVGGAGVYEALWPWVDTFYCTRVAAAPEGDTHFPAVDLGEFRLVASQVGVGTPAHVFETWRRV